MAAGVTLALTAGACATNPVTGQSQFSLMSEDREIQLGRQLDAEVRREMGVYDDADLQHYVDRIGQRLAAVSHRPNLPWHFAVVNETAVNAFALPGGFVYLTRGILPFLDDEAELAGVLGVAPERVYQGVEPDFSDTIRSFEAMTAAEAAAIRPNRIALAVVRDGDTWESIAARAGEGLVKASTLAIMNHSPADRPPRPGERIKVVVAG